VPNIYLRKYKNYLAAADDKALEIIGKMKPGQAMKIRYSLPRNYGNHKRFFAFIKTAFQIQDHFDNIENFRKWIQLKAGLWDSFEVPNGNTVFIPKSIAFDSLDEIEFQKLFSDCIDVFCNHWGERITKEQLEAIVDFF
jgi:hypothetical protein